MTKKKQVPDYIRYAGLGFQVVAIMGGFCFLGYKLDIWVSTSKPWFLLGFAILGIIGVMILIIRETSGSGKD